MTESGMGYEEYYRLVKDTLGYDGIKVNNENNQGEGNFWIAFLPEQIKNVDNTNPTVNPDIRYSADSQAWQEFLDNNFKAEGTGKNIKEYILPTKQDKKDVKMPTKTQRVTALDSKEGQKERKRYQSIINSENTSQEGKTNCQGN